MSKRKKTSLVVKLVILLAVIWFLNYILYMSRTSKMKLIEESKNLLKLEFAKKIMRPVYDVNCRQIFELNKNETQKAKKLLNKLKTQHADHKIPLVDDRNFIFDKQMCPMYRSLRAIASSAPSAQQPVMSLAYSILTYNNVEQFERLLNLIHEPSNIYCIHVDQKASKTFKQAVESIVNCFDNVFVASQAENIVYAGYSRLKADVNCLGDLFNLDKLIDKHWNFMGKRNVPWKYFVNMASTEMPLRTNYELTRILDVYNGSNEVEIIKSISPNRIKYEWIEDKVEGKLTMTNKTKSAVPHGYKIVKGYAYCLLARRFVEYAIFDPKAKDLLKWSKDTWSPDEWFWATLHYNTKHFPHHGFKDDNNKRINTIARFAGWYSEYECKGVWRHGICIFSVEDLSEMINRKHFIVNKFMLEYDPISYQCMEEWYNMKKNDFNSYINMFFYCNWIKSHSSIVKC